MADSSQQLPGKRVGRNEPCPCGSGKRYKQCCGSLTVTQPVTPAGGQTTDGTLERALAYQQAGRFSEAQALYNEVLAVDPDNADALHLSGLLAHQRGNSDVAVSLIRRAVAISPAGAMFANLGNVLQETARPADAVASYDQALALRPDDSNALSNRGVALRALGRLDDALQSFKESLKLNPRSAATHRNLGNVLREMGRTADAKASLHEAVRLAPNDGVALGELASLLYSDGDAGQAFDLGLRALALGQGGETRALVAQCLSTMEFSGDLAAPRALFARAISEPWGRPGELSKAAIRLIAQDSRIGPCMARAAASWPAFLPAADLYGDGGFDALVSDEVLISLLEAAPVCDISLERLLTMVRRCLLEEADRSGASDAVEPRVMRFYCALARQNFINEYIHDCADDEAATVSALQRRILAGGTTEIAPLQLVAVAAYGPLGALPGAELLLHRQWPSPVAELLTQQIHEPAVELALQGQLVSLTPIDGQVSSLVRAQYEENPYPRWVKAAPITEPVSVGTLLRRRFPHASLGDAKDAVRPDILIAGCGTGQQSIESARLFKDARVLAVDLSRASLAYAVRKTNESGIHNIEYAQADITRLSELERRFDVIESVGVLHHLAEPMAGWRVLESLLKPGGFMRIGLYSELARRNIVAARRMIAQRGYATTLEGIRRCRQDLLVMDSGGFAGSVVQPKDFFTASECRDMLFHVQEHRYSLPMISECLGELGLAFVGFQLDPAVLKLFSERFPGKQALVTLEFWNLFETEYPDTFIGMYQFWLRKQA